MSSTSMPLAISSRGLSKRYEKSTGFSLNPFNRKSSKDKSFWALRDLSFDINQGEGVGIIGHNGAGKSTLLKVLARIIPPSTGEVTIRGSVNSLLEVGTGFQRELSGRDNIYLNASILGMSRSEVNELFDEIVSFSGVGDFIDMPVKNYSSGMYSRLAFAIAAHVTGDILLVDEVLSVGDAEFRKKSLSRMSDLMGSKQRTVLFVSHSMDAIIRLCERVIWLDHGQLRAFGPADEVIREYLVNVDSGGKNKVIFSSTQDPAISGEMASDTPAGEKSVVLGRMHSLNLKDSGSGDTDAAKFIHAYSLDVDGQPQQVFFRDEPVRIHFDIEVIEGGWNIACGVSVRCIPRKGVFDEAIVFTTFSDSFSLEPGRHSFTALIPKHLFASGQYTMNLVLASPGTTLVRHHILKKVLSIRVVDRDTVGDIIGEQLRGVVQPNVMWTFDDE